MSKNPRLEICMIDNNCGNKTILEFPHVRYTNTRDANKNMEEVANKKFKRWAWRELEPTGIFPNGIVDLDTGDCLMFR